MTQSTKLKIKGIIIGVSYPEKKIVKISYPQCMYKFVSNNDPWLDLSTPPFKTLFDTWYGTRKSIF